MVNKKAQMKTKKLKISSLHRPKNCKGQMKIQQTSFMLVAITVFFVLVGLFVLIFRYSGIKDSASLLEEDNARLLVTKLANSPEFSCGNAFGTAKVDCIDADKVMALKRNSGIYEGFWGVSNIEIRRIYPKSEENIECTLDNYPDCNIITIKEGELTGYTVSNFVALCRKEYNAEEEVEVSCSSCYPATTSYPEIKYDKCEIAKLIISYEPAS